VSSSGRIPVLIVSGFLGSGKTSLLRHMLTDASGTAVIVNEFGAVGLDHELLRACEERVELVGGGCACCNRRADLIRVLRDLLDARDRGRHALNRVVIETSGLADPAPIVFTITNDPMLRHHFDVERLVVTVDAVNWADQLAAHAEARKQALVADELVITKVDLVEEGHRQALASTLHAANPAATIRTALHGVLDDRPLVVEAPAGHPTPLLLSAGDELSSGGHSGDVRGGHTGDVRTLVLGADSPVDWLGFVVWLSMLLHAKGQNVLRVKGILKLYDGTLVSVNGVQHVMHMPEHLDREVLGDVSSNVVFITRGIEVERLRTSFEAFQRLARTTERLQAG
jgi:G3E family GTPase